MTPLKRKIADRDQEDSDSHEIDHSPTHPQNRSLFNPFIPFANLQTQWKADLNNTSFYIARLPAHPPSTLSNQQLHERHRRHKKIVDGLANIRREFFSHVTTAQGLLCNDLTHHTLDFAADIDEIVIGLRYVAVRWESFLKRNVSENLQNGKWVNEVEKLASQMGMRLSRIARMLDEIEDAKEDRESEWRRFEKEEELWGEDYENLLRHELRVGTTEMWADWNKYFDHRLKHLNQQREIVRRREGDRYREHRDWVVMTERIDAAFDEWIKWRGERGPEEVELEDGGFMGIF